MAAADGRDAESAIVLAQKVLDDMGERVLSEIRQELRNGIIDIKACLLGADASISSADSKISASAEQATLDPTGGKTYEEVFSATSDEVMAHNEFETFPGGAKGVINPGYALLSNESSPQLPRGNVVRSSVLLRHGQMRRAASFNDSYAAIVVKSHAFECLAGILVVVNAIFLGVEANISNIYRLHPPWSIKLAQEVLEFVFMLFFLAELSLRVLVDGRHFFVAEGSWHWAWFDTFIVSMQVIDQTLTVLTMKGREMSMMSLVRLLRLLRILRLLRVLHLFEDLNLLVRSIMSSASSLCWALLLMMTMIYAFSVFFVQRVMQITNGHASETLNHYFGSFFRTALTLLEVLLGGTSWDEPVVLLYDEVGWLSSCLFLMYICMGVFVLLNVVTGAFVDKAMKTAVEGEDMKMAKGIASAFGLTGDAGGEEVTWDVFQSKVHEPGMLPILESISMDTDHAHEFFQLLDTDGSKSIGFDEMVQGCLRLRGPARSVDVALLAHDQKIMNQKLDEHITRVDKHLVKFVHSAETAGLVEAKKAERRRSGRSLIERKICLL